MNNNKNFPHWGNPLEYANALNNFLADNGFENIISDYTDVTYVVKYFT